MTRIFLTFLISFLFTVVNAQVDFTPHLEQSAMREVVISFTGKIEKGWHVYAPDVTNGPIPASFNVEKLEGAVVVGPLYADRKAVTVYEEIFGGNVSYYEDAVTFRQKLRLTASEYRVEGYLQFGACNEESCLPPTSVDFQFQGVAPDVPVSKEGEQQKAAKEMVATGDSIMKAKETILLADTSVAEASDSSIINVYDAIAPGIETVPSSSMWSIFLLGILGGFIALFTPCVWPIIPMTVSFFLKRSDRRKGIRDAVLYGMSIIVIYLSLGLAVTALFGASALNALSTNAIVNIFFFLLLLVFGISFLGGFEITLPSSWSNSVDSKVTRVSGFLSIFLMAFTLALVSFSCTGPIIGFLLVEMGTSGSVTAPAVGMLGFAIALALPFMFFAIFPAWLKSMPKSGGWMNDVKVVLGCIEIAFSLKFLSVADMAYGWHILDRDVFIALWIILFALLAAYLAFARNGYVIRYIAAACSLAFTLYMVPGFLGAPCKLISAFTPPMSTQHIHVLAADNVEAVSMDFDEGMKIARQAGKPVMIDFTGFGCVNCRKMEAAVWTDESVRKIMTEDYVLIQLYVDDKTPLPEIIEVQENGVTRKLRTVGDKWSYLQRSRFGSNTQPQYVLLDNEGTLLTAPRSYDEDIEQYIDFLKGGLKNYRKR